MADSSDSIKRYIELGVNADPAVRELQKLGKETQKQTQHIDGIQKQLDGFAKGIKGAFAGFQAADMLKDAINGIKGLIDEMDHLGEAAQAVGLTTERLQELQYALQLGGNLSASETGSVLTRMNDKLAELNDTSSNTSRIFKEMGITTKDTVDSALVKMADVFANAPDGIDKTALAVEIFGRNLGQKMVPALNAGSKGMAELSEEAHKLGGIISDDVSKQAAEFNDNLDKLARSSKTVGIAITSELLPPLVEFTNTLVEAIKQGNIWDALTKRWAENNEDRRLMMKRWIGLGGDQQTHTELREQAAAWDKLTESMRKNADEEFRQSQAQGTVPKVAETKDKKTPKGKTPKESATELETWWKALMKAQEALDNTDAKVQKLQSTLADLNAQGKGETPFAKRLQEELQKLKPDAVVDALKKINDEAAKIAQQPKVIEGLTAELVRMQEAGPPAGAAVALIVDELLKLKAAGGDAAAQVRIELEKIRDVTVQNAKNVEEWERLLAAGDISVAEYSEGLSKYYDKVADSQDKAIKKTKDYGDILEEWSGKFATDFIDEMIDSMGKADAEFGDMVESMIKQLAKLIVQMQVAQAVKAMGGGWGAMFSAQGNAWAGPGVEMMATGGILSSPTMFRSGPRLAVAGEAGPEAVVPLQRSSSGDLGVAASPVNVVINNNNPDATVTARPKDNEGGERTIEVYVERKVRSMMTDGSMDRTMRATYGLSRQPAAG